MSALHLQPSAPAPHSALRIRPAPHSSRSALTRAFSLVEIMITVGLLSFIILGLLMMFNQTQRVFRGSMTQSDVLEAGRAITEMISQELQQVTPACKGDNRNPCTNFYAELSRSFASPTLQALPGSNLTPRTNVVQNIFFMTKANQTWTGVGYAVVPSYPNAGVGTLYRFAYDVPRLSQISTVEKLSAYFHQALDQQIATVTNNFPSTNSWSLNVSRIAEGIVHLQVRAFATNGYPITGEITPTNFNARFQISAQNTNTVVVRQAATVPTNTVPNLVAGYYFWSNAVPASVELELGILEPQTLRRYNAIGSGNAIAQFQYLSNHVAQVHLFRRRISVRAVDPSAYQ